MKKIAYVGIDYHQNSLTIAVRVQDKKCPSRNGPFSQSPAFAKAMAGQAASIVLFGPLQPSV
ncbi:MAG: hypothetical protein JRJ86_03140 [Deltaproteobacteria bacterium]|nr:hypothetical protein [Deltaproteobacteria bacterium]MBW2118764.1 hypothetical protein [Deltaproteobacteria bacterium]